MTPRRDNSFTLINFRNSTLFFPFIFGVFFIILILILAVVIGEPTDLQYDTFRIVLALAGGGFAASLTGTLEIRMPIFKKGWIKATTGFAVIMILFFFSPGRLVVDETKLRAAEYIERYNDPNDSFFSAQEALLDVWRNNQEAGQILAAAQTPNAYTLGQAKDYIKTMLSDEKKKEYFEVLERFYKEVIACVEQRNCDPNMSCEFFFEEIEDFRWTYCDHLMNIGDRFADRTWERYEDFAVDECRIQFINYYTKGFKKDQLEKICIPTQCWARHLEPPYPCEVRKQVTGGMRLPGD